MSIFNPLNFCSPFRTSLVVFILMVSPRRTMPAVGGVGGQVVKEGGRQGEVITINCLRDISEEQM